MPKSAPDQKHLQLDAVLSEYNALYRLAEYRLTALDRRIPIIGGVLTAFLGSAPLLPRDSQLLALSIIPVSLVWLVRTTINHARSFEDALRRIEHHEHDINTLLGVDVMGFQSTHPSKGQTVGGRTGTESVIAVSLAAAVMVLGCWGVLLPIARENLLVLGFMASLHLGVLIAIARSVFAWRVYRYR